jgi:hypothetical protein
MKTKRIIQSVLSLFRLAGPWSGIRPRLAMTLRNDTGFTLAQACIACGFKNNVCISLLPV